jgi:hypothetical protein
MGEYSLWVFCQLQDTYTCSDGAIHHSNKQAAQCAAPNPPAFGTSL